MQMANIAVLLAMFIPWVCAGIGKKVGGFQAQDNHDTRGFFAKASGMAARADAAQKNSYEIFAPFAFVVILAQLTGNASPMVVNIWALVFVLSRVAYCWAYIVDKALLRSLCWAVGLLAILALFVVAL